MKYRSPVAATAGWLIGLTVIQLTLAYTYPITIGIYSPMIALTPKLVNDFDGGWNYSTTGESWVNVTGHDQEKHRFMDESKGEPFVYARGTDGYGDSVHKASYTFNGTGLRVRGYGGYPGEISIEACVVGVVIDGRSETPYTLDQTGSAIPVNPQLLANISLPNGKHTVDIYPRTGSCALHSFVVDMDFPHVEASLIEQMAISPNAIGTIITDSDGNGTYNPEIIVVPKEGPRRGPWTVASRTSMDPSIWSGFVGSSLTVSLGKGNIFVRINGTLGSKEHQFKATVIPAPPGMPLDTTVWAFTTWNVRNQAKYMAVLDPNQNYTVQVTVMNNPKIPVVENGGMALFTWFESWKDESLATLVQSPETSSPATSSPETSSPKAPTGQSQSSNSSKSSLSGGVIAGIIIGAVVGALLIALALWFVCLRMRKGNQVNKHHERSPPQSLYSQSPGYDEIHQITPLDRHGDFPPLPMDLKGERPPSAIQPGMVPPSAAESTGHSSWYSPSVIASESGIQPREILEQERDAGSLQRIKEQAIRRIPPSYDPTWSSQTSTNTRLTTF